MKCKIVLLVLFAILVLPMVSALTNVSECSELNSANEVYTLNISITGFSGPCINFTANNITLDFQGYNLTGDGSESGIWAFGVDDSTIKNGFIYGVNNAIDLVGSDSFNVTNMTIQNNTVGIYISGDNNIITDVNMLDSTGTGGTEGGIEMSDTASGNVFDNVRVGGSVANGIYLLGDDNVFNDCNISNNAGSGVEIFSGADGNNITYTVLDSNSNNAIDIHSDDNIIDGCNATSSSEGVYINGSSTGNYIMNNIFVDSQDGSEGQITIKSSAVNYIIDNTLYNGIGDGITLWGGDNQVIIGNTIYSNGNNGIELITTSVDNVFRNNIIYDNTDEAIFDSAETTYLNTIVYNNSFGEIEWVGLNSTILGDLVSPGNITIANNSAYVDSDSVPALNKSANITLDLTGWNITTPRILKDGVECSDCVEISYVSEVIVFSVTGFSNYSVEDTPVEAESIYSNLTRTMMSLTIGFLSLVILLVILGLFLAYVKSNFSALSVFNVISSFVAFLIVFFLMVALMNYISTLLLS